jgi:hypothetical protein
VQYACCRKFARINEFVNDYIVLRWTKAGFCPSKRRAVTFSSASARPLAGVRILVGCPSLNGICFQTTTSLLALFDVLRERGAQPTFSGRSIVGVALARGLLAAQALDLSPSRAPRVLAGPGHEFTHHLQIDDDTAFDPLAIVRMILADEPFVALGVRLRTPDPRRQIFNVRMTDALWDQTPRRGTVAVDAVGAAVTLWRRDCLERLDASTPRVNITRHTDGTPEPVCMFFAETTESGFYVGEDIACCNRWRALGGEVRVLLDADTRHYRSPVEWAGNFGRDFWGPERKRHQPCACGSGRAMRECHGAAEVTP